MDSSPILLVEIAKSSVLFMNAPVLVLKLMERPLLFVLYISPLPNAHALLCSLILKLYLCCRHFKFPRLLSKITLKKIGLASKTTPVARIRTQSQICMKYSLNKQLKEIYSDVNSVHKINERHFQSEYSVSKRHQISLIRHFIITTLKMF